MSDACSIVQTGDLKFADSPESGMPDCVCSRCRRQIAEGDVVIRVFVDDANAEYRYHAECLGVTIG